MTALADERREQFKKDIEGLKVGSGRSGGADGRIRFVGLALMIIGTVSAFVTYVASLTQSDLRDIVSSQILTMAFLALTVGGAALYVAAAIGKVLRLWLVRQLLEGQAHTDQISAALIRRD
ncbi:MAG: hypothetical protein WAW17_33760 [Rhodococcus sp. (in: high G+C Gram-positive bacteria)]|uniref:hypothetical protein n=1 Tax=Rhodococcus sp. TaxID=1831 RepID=UPI003BAEAA38